MSAHHSLARFLGYLDPRTSSGGSKRRRISVALAAAALPVLLLAAACGGDPTATTPAVQPTATPASPGSLVVYSGRSETLVDPIIQQFAAATGIDVKVNYAGTSALAITLLEEGRNSPADVFFAQDPGGLGAVEELLAPLPQTILDQVPSWARSSDGSWVGLSGRARTLVYSTETLTEDDLPDSLEGLTDPEWRGRIGWAPTNGSFQTMVTGMRVLWGEEKTRQWLEDMQANNPLVYPQEHPTGCRCSRGRSRGGLGQPLLPTPLSCRGRRQLPRKELSSSRRRPWGADHGGRRRDAFHRRQQGQR